MRCLNDPWMMYVYVGAKFAFGAVARDGSIIGKGECTSTSDKIGSKIEGLSVCNNWLFPQDLFEGFIILEYGDQFIDDASQ